MIGWTLGRYLSMRFLTTILAVFLLNAAMIYVVDLIELLRRSGNIIPPVPAATIAYLALLRAPSLSEQIVPFCVLFGTMTAFLILSRKLELLVARAIGVSVWGFLLPPVAIAAVLGIASAAVFNPLCVLMEQRAGLIEMRIFGGINGMKSQDHSLWIRQRSIDGEAFLKAEQVPGNDTAFAAATAYIFSPSGTFEHRIKAASARLLPGVWQFNRAQIAAPGDESFTAVNYLLATGLSAQEAIQGMIRPVATPVWDLPKAAAAAEAAGFDSRQYWLQYHTLLARPLLFVAMVLIAAAFSLRFFRFGGIERMVLAGTAAGFVLYGAVTLIGDLGGAGLLSPT
ncbi:MAG: LptF/LptG family permease, partial [Methylocapsa sp.]|nr:LptF/LptG family permease [Methylocapsa sp.]